MQNDTTNFERKKSPIASYKTKHTPDLQTSNSTQERGKNIYPYKDLHTNVHTA